MGDVTLIDGKAFAEGLRGRVGVEVTRLKKDHNITPGLAVVLIGHDPASQVYVRNKGKQTIEAGMNSFEHKFEDDISEDKLLKLVNELNADDTVNGILVQLPLPKQIKSEIILDAIDPSKDVDGFNIVNAANIYLNREGVIPCTPLGCLIMLRSINQSLKGMNAVIIGRSNIVGKPMAQLLLNEDCTVTTVHSKSNNI